MSLRLWMDRSVLCSYTLTADDDQKNYLDIEKFLNQKLVLKENDQYEVMEIEE